MNNNIKRGVCMRAVFILIAVFSSNISASEFDDYRYVLKKGKGLEVCRHMEKVYNRDFSKHPHDFESVTEVNGIKLPDPVKEPMSFLNLSRLSGSFYPTSPEFEAVKWENRTVDYQEQSPAGEPYRKAALVAHLDINNDGKNEVVAKLQFNGGEKGGWEYLEVLRAGDIDISDAVIPLRAFWTKNINYRDNRIMGGATVRPFIYKKVTYVHIYDYRRLSEETAEPNDRDEPYLAPEKVKILKYRGLQNDADQKATMDLVCEYRMEIISK